jgi:cell division protein FtsW
MIIDKNVRDIIIPVLVLIGIGILMVYSSSAFISAEKYGNGFHYLWKHLFNILVGFIAMIFLLKLDYHKLKGAVIPLLVLSVIFLILVFVPGIGVSAGPKSEVQRWIKLWLLTFQPSELVKITMVLFLSDYISKNAYRMKNLRSGLIVPLAVMAVFQGVILLQPDFGTAVNIGILTLTLLFVGGVEWRYILGVIAASLPVVCILILSASYRVTRVLCFLNPWQEPQGCGFQVIQSFYAFGRGGVTGVGIGDSKQKLFFLPEAHTDFIFSLIGEELGLIGALLVLGLFLYLFIKGFKIAMRTEDSFGYYLAIGLTTMICSQALMNFAVTTGVMPPKGLPLPFISYGGSSLLVNMAAVGILMNIQKNHRSLSTVHRPQFKDYGLQFTNSGLRGGR